MSTDAKPTQSPALPQGTVVPPPVAAAKPDLQANVMSMLKTAQKPAEAAKPAETAKPADVAPADAKPADAKTEKPSVFDKMKKPETAKPAETPAEDPVDKWELPQGANEKTVTDFKNLRTEAKNRLLKATEWEKKYNELNTQFETQKKTAPVVSSETEALRTQLKEAHDKLAVFDIKSHPDFVKQFTEPKSKALAEANEVLAYSGKDGKDLSMLLSKPLKEFNAAVAEMTKDMNSMDAQTVQNALRSAHRLTIEEGNALSKSSELSQQLASRAAANAQKAFESVAKELGPVGDFLSTIDIPDGISPEEKSALESYNQAVAQVRPNAEKIAFGKVDERGMAQTAFKAATMDFLIQHTIPRMEHEYRQIIDLVKSQNEELVALRGNKSPSVSHSNHSSGDGKPDLSKMNLEDGVKALLSQGRKAQ